MRGGEGRTATGPKKKKVSLCNETRNKRTDSRRPPHDPQRGWQYGIQVLRSHFKYCCIAVFALSLRFGSEAWVSLCRMSTKPISLNLS